MKVKKLFHGRKKKGPEQDVLKETRSEESTINCNSTDELLESSTLSMEEEQQQLPREFHLRKYSESIDGSAMAAFARMSSTIADNLTENEFGKQRNNLYRPNTNSYSSQIVHPVVCKRDIFVESVTPTKPKNRRTKKASIYHVNDKESYLDTGKQDGKEEKKTKRRIFLPDIQKIENERNAKPVVVSKGSKMRFKEKPVEQQQLLFTNDGHGTNVVRSGSSSNGNSNSNNNNNNNNNSNIPPISVSASMLFRERKNLSIETGRTQRKKLSIETGRISADESQAYPANPHRLHTHVDQNYLKPTKDWTKFPKFAGNHNVSPSSTVSSLTMPAELETPKALFHHQMKSSPRLKNIREDIQEISEDDMMMTSQNYASERERLLNEI